LNAKGHTTAEYAICLGLLAVLAMGSLKLLGGNIMAVLQAPISGSAQAKTSQLYALIGANAGNSTPANSKVTTGGASSPATLQLTIDPNTGSVLTTTETTGGSKNTTSVPGDQAISLLAQQLKQLADSPLPNGQPIPDNIHELILKLMQDGVYLSNGYNIISELMPSFNAINAANEGKTSNLQPYPGSMTIALGATLGNGVQFQQDYLMLHAALVDLAKSDPSLNASLISPVEQLAGGISSIAYNNLGKPFTENFNANAASTTDLMTAYTQNPSLLQVVSPNILATTLALPPSQSGPAIQSLLSNAALNTQVGFPPSTGSPVSLNIDMPTGGTTGSGSMTATWPPAMNSPTDTSIDISSTGIKARVNHTEH